MEKSAPQHRYAGLPLRPPELRVRMEGRSTQKSDHLFRVTTNYYPTATVTKVLFYNIVLRTPSTISLLNACTVGSISVDIRMRGKVRVLFNHVDSGLRRHPLSLQDPSLPSSSSLHHYLFPRPTNLGVEG